MRLSNVLFSVALLTALQAAHAEILADAQVGIKIPLVKKPSTRPMTVAHIPGLKRYYIADGGLAPMAVSMNLPHQNHKFMFMMMKVNLSAPRIRVMTTALFITIRIVIS